MTLLPPFIIKRKTRFQLEVSENEVVIVSPFKFTDHPRLRTARLG
jgi:hypothetical protein